VSRDYVTIVSGLPRSGTSLMMQMLAAGGLPVLTDGVRQADEDNPRGYFEFEPVKRTKLDAGWLADATGRAVKMVYLLLQDLPNTHVYRVILMQRDLSEVVASQKAMLARLGRTGADVSDERMAAIFEEQLRSTGVWLRAQPNFTVLEVLHRDCVQTAADVAGRVNAFLGGDLHEAAMAGAVDPLLYRRSARKRST
jgi:hypothetical protein